MNINDPITIPGRDKQPSEKKCSCGSYTIKRINTYYQKLYGVKRTMARFICLKCGSIYSIALHPVSKGDLKIMNEQNKIPIKMKPVYKEEPKPTS